ncbi:MAG TPA: secretin N-terminal domain-containing protein [Candidatus Omnitrophota bacterium]|nr:secretin N-terminal domain-containing protein [Candidatus Omnitrophota bacterium]
MKYSVAITAAVLLFISGHAAAQEKELKLRPEGLVPFAKETNEPVYLKTIHLTPETHILGEKESVPKDKKTPYTETIVEEGMVTKAVSFKDFPGFEKKISVDLRAMSVVDVLKFLAVEGDLNFAIAPDVAGTVNLLITDVAIWDVFEIILATNRLAYDVQGNVISVISNNEYKVREGVDFFDRRQTVVYQLKFASAQNLGTLLGNVKSDIGKIIFDDSTGLLVLIDTPQKVQEMKAMVDKAEIPTVARVMPTETEVFELKYAKVEDVTAELTAALTPEIGSMRVDARTNTVVISDLAHNMEKIKTIIAAFDRKTRQVFIEAKIIQVTLSDTFKWGIDWDVLFQNVGGKSGLSLTPAVNMPSSLTTGGTFSVARTTDEYELNAVLEAIATVGETKILSNPHIATEEGKEATINVITQQPYSQTTTTTTDAATTQSSEFTFVDVGVKLNVIPTINADNYLSIVIKPEVSSITSFFPDSASEQRVPVIETANAESTVLVKDGTTIIIAGMIKDTKSHSVNRIPLAWRLPIFGRLFSNESNEIQRTETVVFLTPRIITGDESFLLERDMKKEPKGLRK